MWIRACLPICFAVKGVLYSVKWEPMPEPPCYGALMTFIFADIYCVYAEKLAD